MDSALPVNVTFDRLRPNRRPPAGTRVAAAGIRLSGLQTDGYNFTAEGDSEDPENVLEYSGGVLRLKARAAKAFENKVGYFDPFKIVWSLELLSGATTLSLGTSFNQAYVLFDKPLQTTLYHTVAHLAATAAAGVDAADAGARDKIIRQIWAEFDDEVVRRVKAATQEGVVLKYSHLDSDGVELADLLEDGSGRCGSWARLLAATFRAMGINANVWKILPANDPPLVYPGTHYGTRALQTVPSAAQGTFKALCKERTFEDHAVVAVPTAEGMSWQPIIYDPSYGNSFAAGTGEAALIKWEDESLQYPFIAAVLNNDTNTPKSDIFGNPIYATVANAIGTYDANVEPMPW